MQHGTAHDCKKAAVAQGELPVSIGIVLAHYVHRNGVRNLEGNLHCTF